MPIVSAQMVQIRAAGRSSYRTNGAPLDQWGGYRRSDEAPPVAIAVYASADTAEAHPQSSHVVARHCCGSFMLNGDDGGGCFT